MKGLEIFEAFAKWLEAYSGTDVKASHDKLDANTSLSLNGALRIKTAIEQYQRDLPLALADKAPFKVYATFITYFIKDRFDALVKLKTDEDITQWKTAVQCITTPVFVNTGIEGTNDIYDDNDGKIRDYRHVSYMHLPVLRARLAHFYQQLYEHMETALKDDPLKDDPIVTWIITHMGDQKTVKKYETDSSKPLLILNNNAIQEQQQERAEQDRWFTSDRSLYTSMGAAVSFCVYIVVALPLSQPPGEDEINHDNAIPFYVGMVLSPIVGAALSFCTFTYRREIIEITAAPRAALNTITRDITRGVGRLFTPLLALVQRNQQHRNDIESNTILGNNNSINSRYNTFPN